MIEFLVRKKQGNHDDIVLEADFPGDATDRAPGLIIIPINDHTEIQVRIFLMIAPGP